MAVCATGLVTGTHLMQKSWMPNEERVEYQAIFDFMFNFINQFIVKSCHKLYKHDQQKKKKKK